MSVGPGRQLPPKAQWNGVFFDGQSAAQQRVIVTITPQYLRVRVADNDVRRWPYAELRQTQGTHRGDHVRLERGDPEVPEALVIADPGFLLAMQVLAPGAKFSTPVQGSGFALRVAASLVGAVGLGVSGYFWGIPTLANVLTELVPVAWEERLGESVRDELSPESGRCTDKARLAAVEQIVKTLTAGRPSPYRYSVVIDESEDVNAFAAPGGFIVVFAGLLSKTRSPEELAGVLAHEIQHVEKRHTTRSILRQASMQLLLSALTGDTGQLGQLVGVAGTLGGLRYQRNDEDEADREGMRMLMAAKLDAQGMVKAFQMLDDESGEAGAVTKHLTYLSSHPETAQRVDMLKEMARGSHYTPVRLLADLSWKKVSQGCN